MIVHERDAGGGEDGEMGGGRRRGDRPVSGGRAVVRGADGRRIGAFVYSVRPDMGAVLFFASCDAIITIVALVIELGGWGPDDFD